MNRPIQLPKLMARCTIEPDIDPDGNKIYPDLDVYEGGGATVMPGEFKIRFIERENRINLL
jgi:hypothetical protein